MSAPASLNHDRYIVKSLVHAWQVVAAFHSPNEVLQLRDIVTRTALKKAMCYRLLYTLHECGAIEKLGKNQYRLLATFDRRRKYRIGYAHQARGFSFPQEVLDGLVRACQREGLELIVVDNRRDPDVALRNADHLIKERVDLVVEFQIVESAAPVIAARLQSAGIPVIAVDVPHPGATYFGANNYEAGLQGGHCLGRYAKQYWQGIIDEILMIEFAKAGHLPQMRVDGMLAGIKEVLPASETCRVVRLDGDARFQTTLERVRVYLDTTSAKRVLIGAITDTSALGALRAFQEAGRDAGCAVVGQNAEPVIRAEMREPKTHLIGSVAYFPERYGDHIVQLAMDILSGKSVQAAVFMKHKLITPQNVDRFYPNDSLFGPISREYG